MEEKTLSILESDPHENLEYQDGDGGPDVYDNHYLQNLHQIDGTCD